MNLKNAHLYFLREGEAPAEPHERSRLPWFAARREPRPPKTIFLVPKLLLGNALTSKLCFAFLINRSKLPHFFPLEKERRESQETGQAGAWRRVCSQAGAWEQGTSTSLG